MSNHRAAALLIALLSPSLARAQDAPPAAPQRRPISVFPILVWTQPKHLIGFWAELGINTIVNGEKHDSEAKRREFLDACKEHGVWGVLAAEHFTPALDEHPSLLLWRLADEPDLEPKKGLSGYVPRIPPATVQMQIAKLPASRKTPLWLNTTCRFLKQYRQLAPTWYRDYYALSEICGFDHYPITGWNLPERLPELEEATRECRALAGGQPVLPIVEASDQDLAWTPKETRGPTGAEMRAEVMLCLAAGARGIGYFTIAFNPFRWKNLEGDVAQEMKRTNAQLAELADWLVREPTEVLRVKGAAEDLRWGVRPGKDDSHLLIVVNRSRQPLRAEFRLENGGSAPNVLRSTEGAADLEAQNGVFVLELAPLEGRFYLSGLRR